MQIRGRACLSSGHARLVCAFLARQSMVPLIYQLFGLPDVSQSPHLFLKLGHQAEQFIYLATSCIGMFALALHLREQRQAHCRAWELGDYMNGMELHLGGCISSTGCWRNGRQVWGFLYSSQNVCASLLSHTWQNIFSCVAVGWGGNQKSSPHLTVSRVGRQSADRVAEWATLLKCPSAWTAVQTGEIQKVKDIVDILYPIIYLSNSCKTFTGGDLYCLDYNHKVCFTCVCTGLHSDIKIICYKQIFLNKFSNASGFISGDIRWKQACYEENYAYIIFI